MPQRATPLSSAAAVADRRIQGIQDVPLDQLRPHPENPRRISRDRLDQLKKLLTGDPAMLQARPLIALPDGTEIDACRMGHGTMYDQDDLADVVAALATECESSEAELLRLRGVIRTYVQESRLAAWLQTTRPLPDGGLSPAERCAHRHREASKALLAAAGTEPT